ncbi:MAG TPA: hypothetical protein VGN00_06095 [Puia sp.]|jgi:hypothetical protein
MEKALEEMSASALRNLLIEEVKKFIIALDIDSTEDLDRRKLKLRKIFNLISEKEKKENLPLIWGKNSTNQPKPPTLDL